MSKLKTWINKLPADLKENMKVYAVRNHKVLKTMLNDALNEYLYGVKKGEDLVNPRLTEYTGEEVSWLIMIDEDYYKEIKVLSIEKELRIYDLVNSAFVHYLTGRDTKLNL